MEYRPIAQTEQDAVVEEQAIAESASYSDRDFLTQTPTANLRMITDSQSPNRTRDIEQNPSARMGSISRPLASAHSYEVVQGKNYDEQQIAPLRIQKERTPVYSSNIESPTFVQSHFEEAPARTASISRHLPLNHPRPDLQSMQGAYVKNVERLEESADRLSMTSSLEEELQRMKLDQRRLLRQSSVPTNTRPQLETSRQLSVSSLSNSITSVNATARWGGYSPSGYVTSFADAVRAGSQSSHQSRSVSKGPRIERRRVQSEVEGKIVESLLISPSLDAPLPPPHSSAYPHASSGTADTDKQLHRPLSSASIDRSPSSASNDTYRQATSLFRDFDGVHYTTKARASLDRQFSAARQILLDHPPLAADSNAHRETAPDQHMVYYPAPVPVMLNLPQKLSKFSTADRDKRRMQALSGVPFDTKKSTSWLQGDQDGQESARHSRQALVGLPPQLRASAFFDQPSVSQNLKLQGGSAVATLDSILDAAAHAPVTAFTDHPIAGQLGGEVYGKEVDRKSIQLQELKPKKQVRRLSSLSNMLGAGQRVSEILSLDGSGRHVPRESKASELETDIYADTGDSSYPRFDGLEGTAEQAISPSDGELEDREVHVSSQGQTERRDSDESSEMPFTGAPTTLLAELQMRKAQQKQRNRTAADAFPNGMHSTLLELDAVTQLQQKSRKQKHITLAWEDHEVADQENFDDDDIPLGILFPGQKNQANVNRPVGLLEKRHIEDNEPLSHRKTRLRGDAPPIWARSDASLQQDRIPTMYTLNISQVAGDVEEQDGETLAQRLRRLRAEKEQWQADQLANERISQLGLLKGDENGGPISKTPNAEETLGQRRTKLRDEAPKGRQVSGGSTSSANAPPFDSRQSMAGLLSTNSVNGAVTILSSGSTGRGGWPPLSVQQQSQFSGTVPPFNAMPVLPGYPPAMPLMSGPFMHNNPPVYSPNMAVQMGGYGYPFGMQAQMPLGMGPPLDPKQRDGIERWRQSVA